VLAGLDIAGVPRVRDFFLVDRTCYIVMDLVQGHNLEQEMESQGHPLPPQRAVELLLPILDILRELHRREPPLVHRDVKPANIVLDQKGRVWLVDFGLVATYTGVARTRVGTLGYAPWEQMEGQAEPRSDLYAVGASFVHLLVGQPPAPLQCPPLRDILPEIDPALAVIVDKATAQRMDSRWPSAEDFAAALRAG